MTRRIRLPTDPVSAKAIAEVGGVVDSYKVQGDAPPSSTTINAATEWDTVLINTNDLFEIDSVDNSLLNCLVAGIYRVSAYAQLQSIDGAYLQVIHVSRSSVEERGATYSFGGNDALWAGCPTDIFEVAQDEQFQVFIGDADSVHEGVTFAAERLSGVSS